MHRRRNTPVTNLRRVYDVLAVVTLPSFARRPSLVTGIALAGLFLTCGAMVAFDAQATLGAVALAPWIGLIGFDTGAGGGGAAATLALVLWIGTATEESGQVSALPIAVRAAAFALLGLVAGVVGQRLRESEASQRSVAALQAALIDSTLDGICLTDPAGNILIMNAPLVRFAVELGMPLHGTVPERLLAIADRLAEPERYKRRMRELASSTEAATTDEFELAGTGRCFRGYTAPVLGTDGKSIGRVWTLREVTADRELDRMRDAFIATVSHELRTPLTSISGFLEMMEDEEHDVGTAGRTYLDVIRRSTERLKSLVEDLLLIAQIEARRVELDLETVDLTALTRRSVDACRPAALERDVSLEVIADHAPLVRADARRLEQVTDNLISNAIKFSGAGGSVTVSIGSEGDSARLVVADTGIGIPADEVGEVFSRFFRSSTAARAAIPGTGLGLSITRALVEQHGGSISLESVQDRGTTVTVHLPATSAIPA
jgi:signal transduction histidine kinase